MQDEYQEMLSMWKAYKESGNNHGILFICDRLATLYETFEDKPATEIYETAYESLSKINLDAICMNNDEYLRMRNYYKSLSNGHLIVREPNMISDGLIKDFIRPCDARLLFDQQDLRQILYNYSQLGYVDIENSLFYKFDYIVDYCIRTFQKESTSLLAIILIKGGDKETIMNELRESTMNMPGIQVFFAHNINLGIATSIRVYFFDKSKKSKDVNWQNKVDESIQTRFEDIGW